MTFQRWLEPTADAARAPLQLRAGLGALLGNCPIVDPCLEYRFAIWHCSHASVSSVGLIRRMNMAPFDEAELEQLAGFADVIGVFNGAQNQTCDRTYEVAALRALGSGAGWLFIIDLERADIVWADTNETVLSATFERELICATKQLLRAQAKGEPPVNPPRIENSLLVRAAHLTDLGGEGSSFAACRVQLIGRASHPMGMLSPKELRIAQLLAVGYTAVNVASITGITEHTVRTYIRRIYRKLAIGNRLELVHCMDASEVEPDTRTSDVFRIRSASRPSDANQADDEQAASSDRDV